MEVDRLADLVGEPLEQPDRLDRQADVRLVRELVAHAAGVATGRSGAEQLLALDQHDVGDAAAREVVGDARAHAAAADDYDIGRRFIGGEAVVSGFRVRGSGFRSGSGFSGSGFGGSGFWVLGFWFWVRRVPVRV